MADRINIAKKVGKESWLGRTLPSLIFHTKAVYPNDSAFMQFEKGSWEPFSTDRFIDLSEEFAVGLLASGLQPGDRVALYLESDVYFCITDMSCLMAGLVDVPIYLTHSAETIRYVLGHADAQTIVVSDGARLKELSEALDGSTSVHTIVVIDANATSQRGDLPSIIQLKSFDEVCQLGKAQLARKSELGRELCDRVEPSDLATIIYTSGTTGLPKGVMLTHENISSNALMAYAGMVGYRSGAGGEVMLSFLPLTHVFARTLYYGALAHGTSIYFSHPDRIVADLASVRPTILPTVPRVLEKVYARIVARTDAMGGLAGKIARWGLSRAQATKANGAGVLHKAADKLVYQKWRDILGGKMRFVISGGAALNAGIAGVFAQAGITILQGYGLTETSPVIAFNRPNANRLGTVGQALDFVELKIADDGEIVTRGPHIMAGYFKDPQKTKEVIDESGWFHTGDIGHLSEDGFLTITDRKKDLFKLSTGKYVTPQLLETAISSHPLVDQSVVVGDGHKFAAALLFPNGEHIRILAKSMGITSSMELKDLIENEKIVRVFDQIVAKANQNVPHWSTIKRFRIVLGELSVENALLTPTLKVKRAVVIQKYADVIHSIYQDEYVDDLKDENL